jgi:predicted phage baseplate assembly protein
MGLNVPDLDDRTFEELLENATRSIPVHTDEWTDHNESDPGITILEVLAWVAESDIYRLDRVTEIHVRKYLQLLGVQPRPPQPASTRLALSPDGAASGTEIEAGEALLADDGSGSAKQFETTADLRLTDAEVAAVVSAHREGQVDNTTANESDSMHFLAFGPAAEGGSAMYVGFDEDPFADAERLDLAIDFHDDDIPDPATHGPDPVAVPPIPPIGRRRSDGDEDGAERSGTGSVVEREYCTLLYSI